MYVELLRHKMRYTLGLKPCYLKSFEEFTEGANKMLLNIAHRSASFSLKINIKLLSEELIHNDLRNKAFHNFVRG